MSQPSAGQRAYEEDVRRRPHYEDGGPRPRWDELPQYAKWSWERNPTPRWENWVTPGTHSR